MITQDTNTSLSLAKCKIYEKQAQYSSENCIHFKKGMQIIFSFRLTRAENLFFDFLWVSKQLYKLMITLNHWWRHSCYLSSQSHHILFFYVERYFILLYLIIRGYLWYLSGLIEIISNCADKANFSKSCARILECPSICRKINYEN